MFQYNEHDKTSAKSGFVFTSPLLHYDYHDSEQQKKLLVKQFAEDGGFVPQLLKTVWDAPDFYFDSLSQISMDHWSTGRTVLLGDAGYCASPGSGQGTSLALVGAYVLAGELAEAGGDYQVAFARYENALRDYVEVNQKLGMRGVKVIIPRTQTDVWVRAQMIRLLAHLPWKRFLIGQTTRAVQTAANAINLKDYET